MKILLAILTILVMVLATLSLAAFFQIRNRKTFMIIVQVLIIIVSGISGMIFACEVMGETFKNIGIAIGVFQISILIVVLCGSVLSMIITKARNEYK